MQCCNGVLAPCSDSCVLSAQSPAPHGADLQWRVGLCAVSVCVHRHAGQARGAPGAYTCSPAVLCCSVAVTQLRMCVMCVQLLCTIAVQSAVTIWYDWRDDADMMGIVYVVHGAACLACATSAVAVAAAYPHHATANVNTILDAPLPSTQSQRTHSSPSTHHHPTSALGLLCLCLP